MLRACSVCRKRFHIFSIPRALVFHNPETRRKNWEGMWLRMMLIYHICNIHNFHSSKNHEYEVYCEHVFPFYSCLGYWSLFTSTYSNLRLLGYGDSGSWILCEHKSPLNLLAVTMGSIPSSSDIISSHVICRSHRSGGPSSFLLPSSPRAKNFRKTTQPNPTQHHFFCKKKKIGLFFSAARSQPYLPILRQVAPPAPTGLAKSQDTIWV